MRSRSSSLGYGTVSLNRKRSSCASGSGYVPSISIGFCVARTKNGSGSVWVVRPAVTRRSCIASSRADCVLGVARLTSSARTRLANSGPGWNSRERAPSAPSRRMLVPVMSAGIRSGVNCTRLKLRSSASPMVRTSSVLPRPGMPSSSAWPPASRQVSTPRTTSGWPMMTWPTSVSMARAVSMKRYGVVVPLGRALARRWRDVGWSERRHF